MSVYEIELNGQTFEVEASSPQQAAEAAAMAAKQPAPRGVANNLGGGIAEGALGLASIPRMGFDAAYGAGRWAANQLGFKRQDNETPIYDTVTKGIGPTLEEAKRGVEPLTGPFPEAKDNSEKYARTIGSFVPGGFGPGSIARRLLQNVAAPGAGSEYAGQRTEGTPYEGPSRIAGALLGLGVGATAGVGYTAARNRLTAMDTGRELSGITGGPVGGGASARLLNSLEADRTTGATAARTLDELGPEAMVLDTGRQMRGRAEAVATQPGRGQNTVLDAVEGRTGRFGEGTAGRVAQTLDNEMGPTRNVVELVDHVETAVDRVAGPLYKQVMQDHPVVWDNRMASLAERPAIAQAMKDAKTVAANYGETISIGDGNVRPSLRAWDYVKKALDQRIRSYYQSGQDLSGVEKADLGGLESARRALVTSLDEITNGAYKQARDVAAQKPQLKEALEFGRDGFNKNILPEQFAAELADMSIPQQHMARAGYRRELDKLIETTRNEGATARRLLDTNGNLQKIEMLFGPDQAREIARRIGAENIFTEATTDIARNSRTAVRQQLVKDTATPSTAEARGTSALGLGAMGLRAGTNYFRAGLTENMRGQIADVLTQGGENVPLVVRALERGSRQRAANSAPVGDWQAALINALIQGGRQKD